MTYACKTVAEGQHLVRLLEQEGFTATLTVTARMITVTSAVSGKRKHEIMRKFNKQRVIQKACEQRPNMLMAEQEELI